MIIVVRKEISLSKSIALCAMLFFIALDGMLKKQKKQPDKVINILSNCGLVSVFIPQNIAVTGLMRPYLSFQDVGRLRQVSKVCSHYWNPDNFCLGHKNGSSIQDCPVLACRRLASLCYDRRTRVLAHYAEKKNTAMFQHVWNYEQQDRALCMCINYGYSYLGAKQNILTVNFCMEKYKNNYCNTEKIHSRYFEVLMRAIGYNRRAPNAIALLKRILPGSGFNIFTVKCRKRQSQYNGWCKKIYLIAAAEDANLLVAMVGGRIEPYMFNDVFLSDKEMVEALFEMGVVNLDECDKWGNFAQHYYQAKMHPPVYIPAPRTGIIK